MNKKHIRIYFGLTLIVIFVATNILAAGFAFAQSGAPDTKEPSDVENVRATPGDSEIMLSWDPASDEIGVAGYKIYRGTRSVKNPEDRYDLPIVPVGNVNSYSVKNLTNGQTYYFSLTAVDIAGNESVNYSFPEVSATPRAGLRSASIEDDSKSPQVINVKAEDNITVLVEFSEPIKLPEESPESAFQIEKISDKSRLRIQDAVISDEDETGKTVVLTTAPQLGGTDYLLTAGIEIEDFYSNPVESGTSDTGSFRGSAKAQQVASVDTENDTEDKWAAQEQEEEEPIDSDAPKVTEAVADYNNRISITFDEKVVLPVDPTQKIVIYKKGTQNRLKVSNVSLSVEELTVYVTTDPQENAEYEIQITGVKDTGKNELKGEGAKITVIGNTTGLRDITPPEDVTALAAKLKDKEKNIVELSWKASKNSANDLNDQILYQGEGKVAKSWSSGKSLGADPITTDVEDLEGGKWYSFKVATKDSAGNESTGAVTSLYITKTGPGMIAAGLTSLVMGVYSRRKKKKNI